MLPNENVLMSVGHYDLVLTVYSSMEHVTRCCVGSVSARSLQTEPTARLWVRVRSTDVYRVISLGKIFTTTRLG